MNAIFYIYRHRRIHSHITLRLYIMDIYLDITTYLLNKDCNTINIHVIKQLSLQSAYNWKLQVSYKKMFENKRSFMREDNLKLVCGTPEPDFISKVESFGDLILQRLSIYGDSIGLVSIYYILLFITMFIWEIYRSKPKQENPGNIQK